MNREHPFSRRTLLGGIGATIAAGAYAPARAQAADWQDGAPPEWQRILTAARDANYSYAGAMAILLALLIFVISGPFLRRISSR